MMLKFILVRFQTMKMILTQTLIHHHYLDGVIKQGLKEWKKGDVSKRSIRGKRQSMLISKHRVTYINYPQ